jgi:hypothetical protein
MDSESAGIEIYATLLTCFLSRRRSVRTEHISPLDMDASSAFFNPYVRAHTPKETGLISGQEILQVKDTAGQDEINNGYYSEPSVCSGSITENTDQSRYGDRVSIEPIFP